MLGLAAIQFQSGGTTVIHNPIQYGSGGGAGAFYGVSNPIYIPYKHPIQTYRSQQRAAKKRRK